MTEKSCTSLRKISRTLGSQRKTSCWRVKSFILALKTLVGRKLILPPCSGRNIFQIPLNVLKIKTVRLATSLMILFCPFEAAAATVCTVMQVQISLLITTLILKNTILKRHWKI
ncbi:hypothetical protein FKM82_025478 [Ascaphus truei]